MTVPENAREFALGALLGAFVGDAVGMPYEGQPGSGVPEHLEMTAGRAPAGSYTDDTQMMIALAESLLRCGGIDERDLAATFRAHFDPGRGYGSGTRTVIGLWDRGVAVSVPQGADGAVVQAVAVAAAMGRRDPLTAALTVASTTPMRRRLRELAAMSTSCLDPRELGGPDWAVAYSATASVPVAVVVGSRAQSFEEAVTVAVRCGGDTDTVAAMAGAIAGARFGAASIPTRWYTALEDGKHGRSHVERLAHAARTAPVSVDPATTAWDRH
jgi:poly(ADP-ribose) glycohydrolase ARH3